MWHLRHCCAPRTRIANPQRRPQAPLLALPCGHMRVGHATSASTPVIFVTFTSSASPTTRCSAHAQEGTVDSHEPSKAMSLDVIFCNNELETPSLLCTPAFLPFCSQFIPPQSRPFLQCGVTYQLDNTRIARAGAGVGSANGRLVVLTFIES